MSRLQAVGLHIEVDHVEFEYQHPPIYNGGVAEREVEFEDPFQREMEAVFSIEWMHHDQGEHGFRYDLTYSPKRSGDEITGMVVSIRVESGNGAIRGARLKYVAIGS